MTVIIFWSHIFSLRCFSFRRTSAAWSLNMKFVSALLALIVLASAGFSQTSAEPAQMSPDKWRADLKYLATQIERTHKNAYHTVTRDDLLNAVNSLDARLADLEDHQVVVEIMKIVAMIGDGHTGVRWGMIAQSGMFPVIFYVYEDGVFVQKAAQEYSKIVGGKVVKVGNIPINDVIEKMKPYMWCDNDMGVKSAVPWYLASPKILHAVGLSAAKDSAEFTILKDGLESKIEFKPTGKLDEITNPPAAWLDARSSNVPVPAWQKEPRNNFRFEMLHDSRTFYIQFNQVQDKPDETVEAFFKRALDAAEKSPAERLVLDIRLNGGGNNYLNLPIIIGVIRSRLNVRGRFFVIIGRETFSAAQNTVNDLEKYTNAIFVGEPTGASPNHYGDARPIILPNSKLRIQASTLWWQDKDPRDTRKWTAPTVAADLSSDDYRNGRDPALEAILKYKPVPSMQEIIAKARSGGSVADLIANYKEFRSNPLHKYVDTATIMNRVGQFLLNERRPDEALTIFKVNAEDNPGSAIVYQSLGDVYDIKGDKVNALANYKKAVSIDPKLTASAEAIKRLSSQ